MQVLENNLRSKDVVGIKSTHYCSTKIHIDTKALDKRWRGYTGDDNIRKDSMVLRGSRKVHHPHKCQRYSNCHSFLWLKTLLGE